MKSSESTPRLRTVTRFCLVLASACCHFAGCRPDEPAPSKAGAAAAAIHDARPGEEIRLALNWFPEAEHGGYFAALVHGYYQEAGLNVKILPGGPSSSVLERVASGQVTFGIENADRVLLARAQEADAVAVMAPLQRSPRAIMVHARSGFRRIEDLSNVTLAVNAGAAWVQYLKKRVPFPKVRFVPYSGSVAQFLVDENYAQQAYVFSEPFVAQEKGADVRCLLVADAGFNPYTSLLVTSGDTLRNRPELVRKFVTAAVRGWQTYLDRPDETNGYIHNINPEMSLAILAFGVKSLRPLCTDGPVGTSSLGQMTADRWKSLAGQLVEAEALAASSVDPLRAFTTEFLPQTGDVKPESIQNRKSKIQNLK